MSIKIYNAYRIRKQHCYWDVLMKIQATGRKNATKALRKMYASLLEHWTKDPEAYLKAYADIWGDRLLPPVPTLLFARDYVYRSYGKQLQQSEMDTFDLNVSVAVRRVNKRYLLIPYPGSGLFWDSLKFMDKMPELEDYHYQDQADAPFEYDPKSKITPTMWRERKKTWTPILDEPEWSQMLALDICTYGGFTKIDPWFEDLVGAESKKLRAERRAAKEKK